MGEHSILSASGMHRWKYCPGSVRLCAKAPKIENEYAKEGTRVHDLAARFIKSELPAEEYWKESDEVRASIFLYAETINTDHRPKDGDKLFIERKFDLSSVFPGCFGTTDAALWKPKIRHLIVYDYKNGTSPVEVENNEQLDYYLLGALVTLALPAKTVEKCIVQPRAKHKKGPVRRQRQDVMEFLDFEDELVEAAKRTQDPKAPLVTGRYCYFCDAKPFCPAVAGQRVDEARESFTPIEEDDDPFDGLDDDPWS